MAVQLFGYPNLYEQAVVREASSAGIISMEHLNSSVSDQKHHVDCMEITDFAVPKFRKVISMVNRIGHARFRRAPAQPHPQQPLPPLTRIQGSIQAYGLEQPQILNLFSISPQSSDEQAPAADQPLKNHFTQVKDCFAKNKVDLMSKDLSLSATVSTSGNSSSSLASTITGEGSVSNGKGGSPPKILAPAFSSGKPPLSGKSCRQHNHSDNSGNTSRCHCKKSKNKLRKTIRVPAVSSKIADIPPDKYSWRKYGQKPIKGSPYPRGYYRCSTVRGCPARKHVERAKDDPAVLIVTYDGEHRHTAGAIQEIPAALLQ